MKKIIALFLAALTLITLSACNMNAGKIKNVNITQSPSAKFSKEEITAACDAVLVKFREFEGCELTDLWYDEDMSNFEIESANQPFSGTSMITGLDPANVIVLYSVFTVNEKGGNGGFEPNSTQTNWMWFLTRESGTAGWKVIASGY
ncbi:MAG: DUF4829 domain-containing protein [Oscillospiraceae bacterium]|nr:DUF4829 domain-containing protein [Oscillospiraceae bacterium]